MKTWKLVTGSKTLFVASMVLLAGSMTVSAQTLRNSFISVNGVDTNNCTRSTPCRQVNRALAETLTNGTVTILDGGEYDKFAIFRSVTVKTDGDAAANIYSDGATPSVVIFGGTSPYPQVTLRGLSLDDHANGIVVNGQIDTLHVEDTVIEGGIYGVFVNGAGSYFFKNTLVRYATSDGLHIAPPSGTAQVFLDDTRVENNVNVGVGVNARTRLVARNSIFSRNLTGVYINTSTAVATIENCSIVENRGDGVAVNLSGRLLLSNSTVQNNAGYGIRNNTSSFRSFSNNKIYNNTLGGFFGSITPTTQQ